MRSSIGRTKIYHSYQTWGWGQRTYPSSQQGTQRHCCKNNGKSHMLKTTIHINDYCNSLSQHQYQTWIPFFFFLYFRHQIYTKMEADIKWRQESTRLVDELRYRPSLFRDWFDSSFDEPSTSTSSATAAPQKLCNTKKRTKSKRKRKTGNPGGKEAAGEISSSYHPRSRSDKSKLRQRIKLCGRSSKIVKKVVLWQ